MPELLIILAFPFLTGLTCLLTKNWRIQYAVTLSASVLHLFISFIIFIEFYVPNSIFMFGYDSLSKLFLLILSNVYFWIVLVSYSYIQLPVESKSLNGKKYYFILMNFYLVANSAAVLSNHFGMYWVAAELTTLSVAPLVYYSRSEEALVAMWRYLFIVSVGIAFAFIGILFLALSAKGTILDGEQLFFMDYLQNATQLSPIWLKASFIFIFVGLSTKIGIAPMHSGDIDATSSAPSPIAALFSGSLRIVALLGVLRIFQIIRPTDSFEFARTILVIGGLFSIFVTFVFMFKITDFKKMAAYSSVEHLGIITLGIGIGGLAFIGAMYHIVFNSMTKIGLFLSVGKIHYRFDSRKVSDIYSVMNRLRWTGWLLLLSFFAVSGIPPFGFFFSEIKIFEGILFSDKPVALFFAMLFMLFIFINMGYTIFTMLYKKGTPKQELIPEKVEEFDIFHFATIALLIIMTLIAVLSPDVLTRSILSIANDFGITI